MGGVICDTRRQDGGRICRREQDVNMSAEEEPESVSNNWFLACPQLDTTRRRGALTRFRRRIKTLRHSKYFHTVQVEEKLLMLPSHLIQQCIQFHHTSLGHPDKARTKVAIGESYYWSTLVADINSNVQKCRYCGKRKTTH